MNQRGGGQSWVLIFLRTAGLRLFTLPFTAAASVASSALIVRHTGVEPFGYITLVAQLTMLLPFADLGLGTALTRRVAQAAAGQVDMDSVRLLARRAILILLCLGGVLSALAIVAASFGVWSRLFSVPPDLAHSFDIATCVVLVVFFMLLPGATGQRVLVGLDRSALLVGLGLIPPAVNLAFVALATALDAEPMTLALGTAAGSIATVASFALLAYTPRLGGIGLKLANRHTNLPTTGELLHAALPMLVTALGTAGTVQTGRAILAASEIAPSDLAEFSLTFQLYLPLFSVVYMGSTILWPRFSVALDHALWVRANVLLTALGVCAGVALVLFGPLLVDVMSDGEAALSPSLSFGFALLLAVQGAGATQAMLLTTPQGLRLQACFAMLSAMSTVSTSILTTPWLGPAAPAYSAAVSLLLFTTAPGIFFARRRFMAV
ncbi:hypothetical protein ACU6RU_15220 [Microbacterium sp. F1-18]